MTRTLFIFLALILLSTRGTAVADEAHLFDDLDGDGISDSYEQETATQPSTDDGTGDGTGGEGTEGSTSGDSGSTGDGSGT